MPTASPPGNPEQLHRRLADAIAPRGRLLTAYSGGVDSTLVAAVARQALGKENAPAVLGDSASLPRRELADAVRIAEQLDLDLHVVRPGEQHDEHYRANAGDRCYFCKSHLYAALQATAGRLAADFIANGTNLDDLGDHRPGLQAADECRVVSPLVDAKFTKQDVRTLAQHLHLPNADKPAAACLASRIPYGTEVTAERLAQVEAAEQALADLGFRGFRVRHHDTVARLEVPADQFSRFLEDAFLRASAINGVKKAGYTYVALDLEGFRSGSGNATLTINQA
ncbi:MAG: ATP-dependent sacrificial sulfur transferase LarE [Planctomycetota bacterium]